MEDTLLNILDKSVKYLSNKGIENPRFVVEKIFCTVLDINRIELYTQFERLLSENEKKILDILKSENSLKTLYSPKINLLVDKSIKIDKTYSSLPYKSERSSILENSYIKEETNINWKEKSFSGFFKYIFKKITE